MRWVTLLVVGTLVGCNGSNPGHDDGGNPGGSDAGGGEDGGTGPLASCKGAVVHDDAELQAFADCTEITGALEVTGDALTAVKLAKLERVSEAITIHDAAALTAVSLPALVECGSFVIDGADTLATLELPALARTGGNLWLGSRTVVSRPLPVLGAVKLPALRTVGGQLHVVEVHATELAAPLLASAGGVMVSDTFLADLALPALAGSGAPVVIDQNSMLGHVDLGSLTSINGGLFVRGNGRFTNALDTRLDLHELPAVAGSVEIAGNALTTIALDALASIDGRLALTGNDVLALRVPLLATISGDLDIAHNRTLPAVLAFPSLGSVGGIVALGSHWNAGSCTVMAGRDVPSPFGVSLPALTGVHGLSVCDERGLTEVSAPKLPSMKFSVAVAAAPELVALKLDGLAELGNRLIVIDNPELTTFTEALTAVKGKTAGVLAVTVQRNPKLGCRGAALVAAAEDRGVAINGNSAACVAP